MSVERPKTCVLIYSHDSFGLGPICAAAGPSPMRWSGTGGVSTLYEEGNSPASLRE